MLCRNPQLQHPILDMFNTQVTCSLSLLFVFVFVCKVSSPLHCFKVPVVEVNVYEVMPFGLTNAPATYQQLTISYKTQQRPETVLKLLNQTQF